MNPTKKELLEFARNYEKGVVLSNPSLVMVCDICEFHVTGCQHGLDAFSLALDGEDVDELL